MGYCSLCRQFLPSYCFICIFWIVFFHKTLATDQWTRKSYTHSGPSTSNKTCCVHTLFQLNQEYKILHGYFIHKWSQISNKTSTCAFGVTCDTNVGLKPDRYPDRLTRCAQLWEIEWHWIFNFVEKSQTYYHLQCLVCKHLYTDKLLHIFNNKNWVHKTLMPPQI